MKKLIILLVALFTIYGCKQRASCVPIAFESYKQATDSVKAMRFPYQKHVNISKSSWLQSASYHSCDRQFGYLIIKTKSNREYIYDSVPMIIWKEFRDASSFGTYYNNKLRGNYRMKLGATARQQR